MEPRIGTLSSESLGAGKLKRVTARIADLAGKGLVVRPGQGHSINVGNPAAAAGHVRSRAGTIRRTYGTSLAAAGLLLALVGCGGSGHPTGQRSATPASSPSAQVVRIAALGDPCCYPSAQGQKLMAQLLYRLGVEPLQS